MFDTLTANAVLRHNLAEAHRSLSRYPNLVPQRYDQSRPMISRQSFNVTSTKRFSFHVSQVAFFLRALYLCPKLKFALLQKEGQPQTDA